MVYSSDPGIIIVDKVEARFSWGFVKIRKIRLIGSRVFKASVLEHQCFCLSTQVTKEGVSPTPGAFSLRDATAVLGFPFLVFRFGALFAVGFVTARFRAVFIELGDVSMALTTWTAKDF